MPRDHSLLRIGLFSIGLDAYWPQFPGLKEKLLAYNRQIAHRLGRNGVEVVNLELVDSPEKAVSAGHRFRETFAKATEGHSLILNFSTIPVSSII
jgi:L-arabinose isomerase